jgi:hypothetical protein
MTDTYKDSVISKLVAENEELKKKLNHWIQEAKDQFYLFQEEQKKNNEFEKKIKYDQEDPSKIERVILDCDEGAK